MIDFYPIDGFRPTDTPLCSIEPEGEFAAVFQRFAAASGIVIDPYGNTRIMVPQLVVLATVCRELASQSSGSARDLLKHVAVVLETEAKAGRGFIAIGE